MNKSTTLKDLIIAQKLKSGEKLSDDELALYVQKSKSKTEELPQKQESR